MGRRTDHSREELADLILEKATAIVEEGGLEALTARNVASAIGYSPGSIYNVFENLDDLVLHLNCRTLDRLGYELTKVAPTGDPKNDLCRIAKAYIDFQTRHVNAWGAVFEHKLPAGRELPEWYRDRVSSLLAIVEGALAPLFPEGKREEVEETARLLWASLYGICSLSSSGKLAVVSKRPAEALAVRLVSGFVSSLDADREA